MESPRTLLVSAAMVALVSSASTRASAQPGDVAPPSSGVDVVWSAPDDCPASEELRRRVIARVPADAAVRARGRVEKRAGRYRLALDVTTASSRGERTLDAPTCEALASSAAVIIAISVAPATAAASEEAAAASSSAPSASAAPSASVEAEPPAPAPPKAAAPSARPDRASEGAPEEIESSARLLARAHVVGDAGLLPEATVGGGIAFGLLALHRLSVEGGANLFASQDGTVPSAPGRGASFSLLAFDARACWTLTHGVEVAPCVGLEVVRIAASGFGAAKVTDADTVTWGPEAALAGKIPIVGPLSVRVGIGGFAPISRQSFVINAAGTVHRPAFVAVRTWAGPEVRF